MTNEPSVGMVGGLPWRPERLRAERRVNPLGVGTAHPWLDWRLPAEAEDATPAGYRVRVATSVTGLAEPDAWDSGWVASTAWACRYGGRPAASRERLCWQVQVRVATGGVSGWSASACWETGFLERQDWRASWIRPGASAGRPRPDRRVCLARRRFSLAQPNLYRLATAGRLPRGDLTPGLEEWAGEPFLLVTGEPHLAQALWSFAHGMAILEIDGRYPQNSDLDQTWETGAAAFAGLVGARR